ncbi:MAG TPA: DegQ family serine endoprotease [Stellaceae bacterium]|nr:DegQ family serine endoprotease [Stellaceae bacterium]
MNQAKFSLPMHRCGLSAPRAGFAWARFIVTLAAALSLSLAASAKPAPDSFADLAAKLLPAVVNISSTQTIKPDRGGGTKRAVPDAPQFPPGSPFEQFFKDFLDRNQRQGQGQGQGQQEALPRQQTSLGSGFIIDPSGLIVTNNHVIEDADDITVTLQDDTNFKAEVVGRDSKTDLALLRVKPSKPLPFVKFGDSDQTRVGDWVLAIGNPFGLGGSVTAGILSARAREINAGPYDDFLQTDAAINRGNSGGPMFNMNGEVIGINTAIYSPSGGSIGIGFAIPANEAKPVLDQIKQYGHARRGWLGVNIQSVNDEIAESLGLDKPRGALIASVHDGGPAQKAGIQPGDVVLTFDGKEVMDMRHLPRIVAETPIDKVVKVTVWRKRKEVPLEVKVGELKEEPQQASLTAKDKPGATPAEVVKALGLSLANLTPDLRDRYGLGDDAAGVVITDIEAGGPSADKGMRAGDVVVEVAQDSVKTTADILAKIDEAKKSGRKSVLLLVDRQGDLRFVAVKLDNS